MIDNSSCISAVDTIKGYVVDCFDRCSAKGSTFTGTRKLVNLEMAINLIPTGGSGDYGGTNVSGASFSGFDVSWGEYPDEVFTIDFGTYGTGWTMVSCYSNSKEGHFNIVKISNSMCIISSAYFVDLESEWDENFGIYPMARGTYRATYNISGNSITFTNAEYDGTQNGWDSYDYFRDLPMQVSSEVNSYYTNPYKLDRITVLY